MNKKKIPVIGSTVHVSIGKRAVDIPAKIDTGADTSSIWASNIRVNKDNILCFSLFGDGSKYYNGKIFKRSDFKVAVVRNANGHEQIRYRTHFTVTVKGKKIKMLMNLSDRSRNNYSILIGRRSLINKFLVDVSKKEVHNKKIADTKQLNQELAKNPYKFHQKYADNMNRRTKK